MSPGGIPETALFLSEKHGVLSCAMVRPGDRVWGLDRFVRVESHAYKGMLDLDALTLSDGSIVTLAPDHPVKVLECAQHDAADRCECPARAPVRVCVGELAEGMLLPVPGRIDWGKCQGALPEAVTANDDPVFVAELRVRAKVCGQKTRVKYFPRGTVRLFADGAVRPTVRVLGIDRKIDAQVCYEVDTEDHYAYLPEHDVVVLVA